MPSKTPRVMRRAPEADRLPGFQIYYAPVEPEVSATAGSRQM
jgi:hypothetical protein